LPLIRPPAWLADVDHNTFSRWVKGQARRLQGRQRRGAVQAEAAASDTPDRVTPLPVWREVIQDAVVRSGGLDHWTGEGLRWNLLREFDPRQADGHEARDYRRRFALMPVLDQQAGIHDPALEVCSLRTLGLRGDLTRDEWIAHCWQLLVHQGLLDRYPVSGEGSELPVDHPDFLRRLSQRMSFHFLRSQHG